MKGTGKKPRLTTLMLDRRQLILGTLTVLGITLLLIVGLTPRSAVDDTAQTGADRSSRLSQDCQLVQHLIYAPCGHELTRRVPLPGELVGADRQRLEAAYDAWQVTGFSAQQVTMEQRSGLYCPEHVVLMADESGMLCVWKNRYGDALALDRELDIPLSDFPEDTQLLLRAGLGFDNQSALTSWLESAES